MGLRKNVKMKIVYINDDVDYAKSKEINENKMKYHLVTRGPIE